jgi:hypothetical protein
LFSSCPYCSQSTYQPALYPCLCVRS